MYCFVETPEWSTELRERHRLFVDIVRLAERLGVEFAFPTQTLYMRQDAAQAGDSPATPGEAFVLGREQASSIVNEFLGGPGVVPPPVSFEMPQTQVDDTQIGEEVD